MAYEDINRQFMQFLGRAATPDEVAYLSKFIQEGSLQPAEIGQIVQGLPEFQDRRLDADVGRYREALAASDQDILGRAGAAINSQFASLGRPVTSAQAGALGQVAQNLAQQRQSALANFYGQGLRETSALQRAYGQGVLERGYGLRDDALSHQRQLSLTREGNYAQKDLYSQYAHNQKRQAQNQFIGQLGGAAIGGAFGGLPGARLGASVGGGFGGLF